MKKPVKRGLIINSICTIGKASITNILPVLSILNIEACPLQSVALSSHTGGFLDIATNREKNFIKMAINSFNKNSIEFNFAIIGYLGDKENIHDIYEQLAEKKLKTNLIFLDTVFADNGKLYKGFDMEYVENLKNLIKFSYVITPNLTEALYLVNRKYEGRLTFQEIEEICIELKKFGCENVIITSIELENDFLGTAIYSQNEFTILKNKKISKSYPGTGDLFIGLLAGFIANGMDLLSSVKNSINFLGECIEYSSKFDYDTKEGLLLEDKLYRLIELKPH